MNWKDLKPEFEFQTPLGYEWVLERHLIDFKDSPLEPWYFLDKTKCFDVYAKWGHKSIYSRMIAFARRGDNDGIACFIIEQDKIKIALINGWTSDGYDLIAIYDTFWDWMKSLFDDIAELVGE